MDHFVAQDGVLHADGVPLPQVAQRFGTPTYVYAQSTLMRHVSVLRSALAGLDARICYAVKANGNLSLLHLLGSLGCSFDGVSLGELLRVQAAGQPLANTIFSGVGKTDSEIAAALKLGVLYISVESLEELQAVASIAQQMGTQARVSVRVNPDVDAKTHPYISTGMAENKFGVPTAQVQALIDFAAVSPSLKLVGLTCHIGSQITQLAPFAEAATCMAELTRAVLAQGVALTHVGMGGGLGIPYGDETPPDPAAYGATLAQILAPLKLQVVLEPGRVLVGNAGVLLTRVARCKNLGTRRIAILDAGMNDLMRPALYGAHHSVEAVTPRDGPHQVVDVVGPVCESADTFAKGVRLPPLEVGDLLILRSAGAYGATMASTYNGRPLPAEVLCHNGEARAVRARQSHAELWRGEEL